MSSEKKPRVKNLESVLITSMPVTAAKKEIFENGRVGEKGENPGTIAKTDKYGKNVKTNLTQVLCI